MTELNVSNEEKAGVTADAESFKLTVICFIKGVTESGFDGDRKEIRTFVFSPLFVCFTLVEIILSSKFCLSVGVCVEVKTTSLVLLAREGREAKSVRPTGCCCPEEVKNERDGEGAVAQTSQIRSNTNKFWTTKMKLVNTNARLVPIMNSSTFCLTLMKWRS